MTGEGEGARKASKRGDRDLEEGAVRHAAASGPVSENFLRAAGQPYMRLFDFDKA